MWYRAFGWEENPFSIRPNPNVVGLAETKDALFADLLSGTPALLLGPTGTGKTSLLLWLGERLRATTFRPVYLSPHALSCPQEKALASEIQRGLLRQRLRLRLKAGLVLLVDEAQELDPAAASLLKEAFDRGWLRSFLLAACTEPALPSPLRSRIGPNAYQLEGLSLPERLALLRHRMDGHNPFTDEALQLLAEAAGPSPRTLLQLAELVCKRLAFKAELAEPITAPDLSPLLSTSTPSRATSLPETTLSPVVSPKAPVLGETTPAATQIPSVSHSHARQIEHARTLPRETNETAPAETAASLPSETRREQGAKTTHPVLPRGGETKGSETRKGTVSRSLRFSPMQEEILRLLSAGPKSVEELAELLQSSPGSVRRQLSRLRRDPALVQSLPHSNPKKFALTIHGQKFLFP